MTARSLLARIGNEHRRVLVALGILAIANVGILALAVYPLSLKVSASQRRADATAGRLAQVEREVSRVHATLATTEQADKDLGRFYADVLPRDVSAARRQTYAHLAQLADEHNLAVTRRTYAIDDAYKGRLQRLQIAMMLTGEYPDIRDFIYALETSPEFVVIEDVSVAEGARLESGLTVNLQLATYFRSDGANGN
jgi:Tfp pilus assembly protein PilO